MVLLHTLTPPEYDNGQLVFYILLYGALSDSSLQSVMNDREGIPICSRRRATVPFSQRDGPLYGRPEWGFEPIRSFQSEERKREGNPNAETGCLKSEESVEHNKS